MFAIEFNAAEERWRLEARCRDGAASLTELFFSEDIGDISRAKAFCAGCVVREACLEYAITAREKQGVWGGLTERERRRMIRQRRKSA